MSTMTSATLLRRTVRADAAGAVAATAVADAAAAAAAAATGANAAAAERIFCCSVCTCFGGRPRAFFVVDIFWFVYAAGPVVGSSTTLLPTFRATNPSETKELVSPPLKPRMTIAGRNVSERINSRMFGRKTSLGSLTTITETTPHAAGSTSIPWSRPVTVVPRKSSGSPIASVPLMYNCAMTSWISGTAGGSAAGSAGVSNVTVRFGAGSDDDFDSHQTTAMKPNTPATINHVLCLLKKDASVFVNRTVECFCGTVTLDVDFARERLLLPLLLPLLLTLLLTLLLLDADTDDISDLLWTLQDIQKPK